MLAELHEALKLRLVSLREEGLSTAAIAAAEKLAIERVEQALAQCDALPVQDRIQASRMAKASERFAEAINAAGGYR